MTTVDVRLDSIKPYERNQKKHPESQINNIAKSIEKYGFVQPLVLDKNDCIIIGHGVDTWRQKSLAWAVCR